MRGIEGPDVHKTHGEEDEMRHEGNHQALPWRILPMILDIRWGRVWSERRVFLLDRLSRLLLLFSIQVEEPSSVGFPVPVGTAGDATFVVDVGLRVLDNEMLVLVPLLLPPSEDETSVAMGPPGKTYGTLGSKI